MSALIGLLAVFFFFAAPFAALIWLIVSIARLCILPKADERRQSRAKMLVISVLVFIGIIVIDIALVFVFTALVVSSM